MSYTGIYEGLLSFSCYTTARALNTIVEHTADTADAVARLEQLLKSVFELREEAADPLAGYVMDVERLCKERTLKFLGRHFLLDEIDRHLGAADFPNGYLVLQRRTWNREDGADGVSCAQPRLCAPFQYSHLWRCRTGSVSG